MLENAKWLGHAGIKITGDKTIYIDPYQISTTERADLILITHSHFDHCSPEDMKKVLELSTIIVTTADAAKQLSVKRISNEIKVVKPGDKITVSGVQIEAVPAYNPKKKFHPKTEGWVGYIVTVNGVRYYHAGDTDHIPEMNSLKVDVAFMPVGGTYTMTAAEAAEAVNTFKPKLAVPMHFGSVVGGLKDAEEFKKLCKVPVEILQIGK